MLAIGIVVDDAIVVVEGAVHNIEKGMSGHDAAIRAMAELFGPIIGITLVLMSVFLPAAFLPGLTGRMYAQFALVIAATALLSAINAATLKPTQSAMWLRPPVPPEQRNVFYRGFNAVYDRDRARLRGLIARMVARSGLMVALALVLIAVAGYGFSRVPTGFLPIEDQGYMLALRAIARRRLARAHPEGARPGLRRSPARRRASRRWSPSPGVSVLDNSATLANAGVAYIILKPWSERGEGEDLRRCSSSLNAALGAIEEAGHPGDAAAADPGHRQRRRRHHAGRAARRQLRSRQAAERHQRDRGQCHDAVEPAAGAGVVPLERAAILGSRSTA